MSAFASLDGLDVVALLLGAVGSFLAVQSLLVRRPDIGTLSRALLFVGLGLILAYLASEIFHALQRRIG